MTTKRCPNHNYPLDAFGVCEHCEATVESLIRQRTTTARMPSKKLPAGIIAGGFITDGMERPVGVPAKLPVTGAMKVNAYAVLSRAVEEGVQRGWSRAHKHVEKPGEDALCSAIYDAVMEAICEVFDFDEGET